MKIILLTFYISCCICLAYGKNGQSAEDRNDDEGEAPDENKIRPIKPDERLRPPSCGVTVAPCDRVTRFRRIDASCNNLGNPEWGLPNSTYTRLLPAKYGDGKKSPRRAVDKSSLPNARRVRVNLFPIGAADSTLANINVMQWGQFVAHDMSLINTPEEELPCCPNRGKIGKNPTKYCFPIKIAEDDPVRGTSPVRCMNFTRTITDKDFGCIDNKLPSNQLNVITPFLDLSNVYGNDDEEAHELREFVGGRFKVEVRNNRTFPPTEVAESNIYCKCNLPSETTCYATGDSRSNQNPHIAILQIIFVREHNRIAKALRAFNPTWNDERLYQEARRINIAQYQRITYYEWLPNLLKSSVLVDGKVIFPTSRAFVNDYNATLKPGVTNEFAQAAFRHFHTQIVGILKLMSPQRSVLGNAMIGNWISRPGILESGSFLEQLTIGLLSQAAGESDPLFDQQMSDKLFACRNEGFGIDLKATDIQRDRDHALAYYNDYRKLFGIKVAKSFDDYKDLISAANVAKLKQLYKSYEDVDLSVGGSLEANSPGSLVGPTFLKILIDQFKKTRQSDRFWFENTSSGLSLSQLTEIRKATVSRLFCDNADGVTRAQRKGFNLISGTNALVACSSLPTVNLAKWDV